MTILTTRKNFSLDAGAVRNAEKIAKQHKKSLTELVNLYFKALTNDASILEQVEKIATQRTGNFVGVFDNLIGDMDSKQMKKAQRENFS